ncbi:MAG: GFA family protein [Cyanothece sp. SIO1E1]|nr:GFA family protein [Cyanothece sp. SIO1E1]
MQDNRKLDHGENLIIAHSGGCHCGRVRFEVMAPAEIKVEDCNCSMCSKAGYLHLLVPKSRFKLLQGADYLTTYTFNTGVAQHYFCSVCGVKSFYVPRSHPDGYSVNARCIDSDTIVKLTIQPFDGANWEAHVAELGSLSE